MRAIDLLPLGGADPSLVSELSLPLSNTFGARVHVRSTALNMGPFFDSQRLQFNSTAIINHLDEQEFRRGTPAHPGESGPPRILGVVGEDLFIPILTYVFGEAQLNGRIAVVSYHRLQNERYGLPKNPTLTFERLCKESVHELGHVYGLIHCPDQGCVMHVSTYVEDIDLKSASFCSSCRTQLSGTH